VQHVEVRSRILRGGFVHILALVVCRYRWPVAGEHFASDMPSELLIDQG
jgi:hypothetical protein